ncbi:MAG: nitrogen regulation protein NR(II) [Thermoanaerobaculia bacterium]
MKQAGTERLTLFSPAIIVALGVTLLSGGLAERLSESAGVGLVLLATGFGAWLLMRQSMRVYPAGRSSSDLAVLLDREEEQRQHARWFVHMRWIAIVVSLGLILWSVPVSGFLPSVVFPILIAWWLVLVVANVVFSRWAHSGSGFERQILVQGAVDLVVLTGFLNASGGIENPVYFAFIFHAIIAGILLPRRKAFMLTCAAAGLFLIMALGEYVHVLPHFTNELFPHVEEAAGGHSHGDGEVQHAAHNTVFVLGRLVPFLALLLLSVYLTSLIAERLRRRESQLEDAGKTLMLEHQRLERVVESTGVGMMLVAPGLTIPWASRRAKSWLREAGGEILDSCPLYGAPNGCSECIAEQTLATGRSGESKRSVRSRFGGRRYFRHATSPVLDDQGRTLQVVELIEDITDRKALEAEALHHGKLSALGQMAAGVAHEIGNPLSSLATRLTLLERRPEPEYVKESVGLLRGQIERIRRIVHGISLFSRHQEQEWSVWDVNGVVQEMLEVVRLDRRAKQVCLETELVEPSPRVRGVRDQITQVVFNLLLNAVEASSDGSEVSVRTETDNGEVRLLVTDHGDGLSEEARERLFEPFFTTKETGTGLGLSICYSLVNAHGGRIEVESSEGSGSTFVVVLPQETEDTVGPGVT